MAPQKRELERVLFFVIDYGTCWAYGCSKHRITCKFLSETEGKYSETDMNTVRRFTYEVDRAIIVIDSGIYTLLNGTWHIVEKSEQQILLQGYYPNKVLITLDRVL